MTDYINVFINEHPIWFIIIGITASIVLAWFTTWVATRKIEHDNQELNNNSKEDSPL